MLSGQMLQHLCQKELSISHLIKVLMLHDIIASKVIQYRQAMNVQEGRTVAYTVKRQAMNVQEGRTMAYTIKTFDDHE
jgi:hypothetical protein